MMLSIRPWMPRPWGKGWTMRRWRVLLAGVATLTVALLIASTVPAMADTTPPPPPPPTTPAEEAVRASVQTMLTGLQGTINQVKANPLTAQGLASTGTDPSATITAAEQQVAQLNSTELDELQAGLSQDPSWPQAPASLNGAVAAFNPSGAKVAAKDFAGTFTDSCDSAGSAPAEFIATEVANEVQSAAQAAMFAVPGVVAIFFVDVPTGVKIALAIVWGVANAVYLALAQTLAVSTDCAATAFANGQISTLPTDPSNPSVNVPGSSEISILNLITAAQGTSTEITNVLNTVNAVNTQANTLVTAAAALNVTLNAINTQVNEVQADLKTLQTNVAILENTEVTILTKADTEIANLNSFQALQLQMDIEENLARNGLGSGPIGLYELPKQFGGYLETVQSIVTQYVALSTSSQGKSDLATANSDFAAGQYKTAYFYYTKAYHDVR
jgi:hypothetical protein